MSKIFLGDLDRNSFELESFMSAKVSYGFLQAVTVEELKAFPILTEYKKVEMKLIMMKSLTWKDQIEY